MPNRREFLGSGAAAAALATLPEAALGARPARADYAYDSLFIDVPQVIGRGAGIGPFVAHLSGAGVEGVRAAGGEPIGYFTPVIGWTSEQLSVLIRWPAAAPGRDRAIERIVRHPTVAHATRTRLAATLRPAPSDQPRPNGIVTQRWFTIRSADVDAFVALSGVAWPEFERDFPTRVFGLFRAEPTAEEAKRDLTRMLLNTQYDSHAVWEASRAPSATSAEAFKKRAAMTLTTNVVSCKFVSLA